MSYTTKLTFLGTGTSSGVPMIGCGCEVCCSTDPRDNRLRSSVFIEHQGFSLLIDAGPDFRQQLLRAGICNLDAILLTHEHKDHTGGLDDVRAINYFEDKAVPIYCEQRVKESLVREYSYVFSEFRYPGIPEFDVRIIDEKPFAITRGDASVSIIPIRVMHYKLPILAYRIGNVAYITDAKEIDESEFSKLQNLDVLVINTVRKERHISHFSLQEAIDIAKKIGAKKSYLTHLSHQIGTHAKLSEELPDGIEAAYDGLILTV